MKGGYHLIFTQYFIILTLTKGRGGIFGKSRGAMASLGPSSLRLWLLDYMFYMFLTHVWNFVLIRCYLSIVKKLSVYPFLLLLMTILIAKLGFTSVNKFSVRMEKYLSPKNMPWHYRNLMYSFSTHIQLYKNAYKWILDNIVALKHIHIHIRSFITVRFK